LSRRLQIRLTPSWQAQVGQGAISGTKSAHCRAHFGTIAPGQAKRVLCVRLPPEVLDWVDERAEELGWSQAELVEDALRRRMRRRS